MKIAHILEQPFNHHGGLQVLARKLASGLSRSYDTYVMCPKSEDGNATVEGGKNRVTLTTWDTGSGRVEISRFLNENIRKHGIRLVIFHGGDFNWGPGAGRMSMLNSLTSRNLIRIYVNHQSTPLFCPVPLQDAALPMGMFRQLSKFVLRWFLKSIQLAATHAEINVSRPELRMSRRRYFLFRNRFRCIYHSRISATSRKDVTVEKEKIVLSIGHYAFRKGQHVLLEAFGRVAFRHPDWKLKIVGAHQKNDYLDCLHAIIDRHGIRGQVELVDETPDPDPYFRAASIYVQPSIIEAYGLALQEAMQSGCACVGSDTGGIPDSITNAKLLFRAGDSAGLAEILDMLMADESLLRVTSAQSLRDSESLGRNRESMLLCYHELISEFALRDHPTRAAETWI